MQIWYFSRFTDHSQYNLPLSVSEPPFGRNERLEASLFIRFSFLSALSVKPDLPRTFFGIPVFPHTCKDKN